MYILYFDCTVNCVNGCYGYYTWTMTVPNELHVHVHVLCNLFCPINGEMEISMISIFILLIFTFVKTFKSIQDQGFFLFLKIFLFILPLPLKKVIN